MKSHFRPGYWPPKRMALHKFTPVLGLPVNRSRGVVVFDNGKSVAGTPLSRSYCHYANIEHQCPEEAACVAQASVLAGSVLQSDNLWTATGDGDAATSSSRRRNLCCRDVDCFTRGSTNGFSNHHAAIWFFPTKDNNSRTFNIARNGGSVRCLAFHHFLPGRWRRHP